MQKVENSIKKIFEGEIDESVHSDFLKFGKGRFEHKFLISARRQKTGWAVRAGAEFVNFLVKRLLAASPQKIHVKGAIISTFDLPLANLPVKKVKKYLGIKQFEIEGEVSASEILEMMEQFPRVFYALSFSTPAGEIKTKAKPPKSGKPKVSIKEENPKPDFCTLKTTDRSIVEDLFFDCGDFTQVSISHTIEVEKIILPENAKQLSPEELRERSKRKGRLVRIIEKDGAREERAKEFEV